MIQLEVACFNKTSAIIAIACNVDRIELCENYDLGGTTPEQGLIDEITAMVTSTSIKFNLMIRPRAGDFVYTSDEFSQMQQVILRNRHNVDGFVFGLLTQQNEVDVSQTQELVQLASPLPCTFHRAFDEVQDKSAALQDVKASGCRAILTSGGSGNASQNLHSLRKLLVDANGVEIIVGGGIRSSNLSEILHTIQPSWIHTAALTNRSEDVDQDELQQIHYHLQNQAPNVLSPKQSKPDEPPRMSTSWL